MIPPRVRSVGFTIGNLFVIPTLLVGPIIGGLADALGPPALDRAAVPGDPPRHVHHQHRRRVHRVATSARCSRRRWRWPRCAAHAERGEVKLLLVARPRRALRQGAGAVRRRLRGRRGRDRRPARHQRRRQVDAAQAISGLVDAVATAPSSSTASDITTRRADEHVGRGIVQVPGGKGVFPTLTVAENLRLAGWLYRDDADVRRSGDRAGARATSRSCASGWDAAGRQPVRRRAADARARPWRSSPSRGC